MSTPNPRKRLPVKPSEENLRKQAKRLAKSSGTPLAEAQHRLARDYGAKHWAELMHIVETMLRGADQLAYVKYEMEALPKAANQSDLARVRDILASGEFTQHDLDLSLGRVVCGMGKADGDRWAIAQLLIEHGADPDGQYGSNYGPIVFAACEGIDVEGIRFLIDHGADVSFAPIDTKYGKACPMGHLLGTYVRGRNDAKHQAIELLLAHGAHIPAEVTPEVLAIHRGDAKALGDKIDKDRTLIRRTFRDMPYGNINLAGATLLHCAVEFGEIECIDAILSRYRNWGDLDMNFRAEVIDGVGGQTPIYHAINTNGDGNFYTLEYLIHRNGQYIDMGVKATWRSYGNPQPVPMTPLEYAEKARREMDPKWAHYKPRVDDEIALLRPLDRRATIRKACEAGDVGTVRTMLDESPDLLTPALWPATYKAKSVELTRLLLDRGLDPNVSSAPRRAIDLACYHALPDIVELLIERGADVSSRNRLGETPLDLLEAYEPRPIGDPDAKRVREALINAGATPDIHSAVRAGDVAEVRRMLDADPTLANTPKPWPPLFTAARAGRLAVARLLIERGADIDATNDKGNTPLWFACQSPADATDRIAVAELLLDHGANPRRGCEDGTTALHFAASRGPVEMVELLIRRGAKEWQTDRDGKTPLDHARTYGPQYGKPHEVAKIIELLDRPVIRDPHFKAAVAAIHAGDLPELKRLLAEHPNLVHDRAVEPECYGQDYFRDPKLLWFVADNPNLTETMPANTVELARAIIDAGAEKSDIDYTIELVATSLPARKQNLQRPLIKLLAGAGGNIATNGNAILGHKERDAMSAMLEAGAPLTAPIAAGMGRAGDLQRLLRDADADTIHAAFSLAVINGELDCARLCLDAGADVNRLLVCHQHSTAAHQAVANDDVPMLKMLVERGADLTIRDTLWSGTPLGWAPHTNSPESAAYLRSLETETT